jgi:hypothetical protein
MRHVPPPLAELTARAQTLSSAGDLDGAREVLARALQPVDADPQRATPDLAVAAALLARVLIALGDPHAARSWAGYAHAAEERLHGPDDQRTFAAAATHAAALTRVGNHDRAARLYRDLVAEYTRLDGPDSARVLAAEAELATAQHAAGHCTAAREGLESAWTRHRRQFSDAEPNGIKMLARLAMMERECGVTGRAARHLEQAGRLCARYLPADHPLAAQLDRLTGTPPSGRHVCGRVRQSAGPAAGVTRVPQRPAGPEPYRSVRTDVPPARRPQAPPPPRRTSRTPPAPQPAPQPPPDDRPTDPKGAVYQAPLYLSQVHQAPGELTGRHARADTPLPVPGQRPEYTDDGRRVPVGTAPVGPDGADRRLPVPVAPEPAASKQPFVLAAVLVAGIGVAAAVVAATLPRGGEAPAPAGSAPPATSVSTPAPSASGGAGIAPGAPTGVRLRDNRDSVSLTWTYPKDAEGPVLISGGRRGQQTRAFQQLPAGSGDYVVYGLNEQSDYCFTVAVVYTTDRVAATAPVCTRRG